MLSAYAVYKDVKPGDKVQEDDLPLPKVLAKRKRSKSQGIENKKKRKRVSFNRASSENLPKRKSISPKKQKKAKMEMESKSSNGAQSSDESTDSIQRQFMPFKESFRLQDHNDSTVAGRSLFKLIINPYTEDEFLSDFWEKKPALLKRHAPHYNDGWFSTNALYTILEQNNLQYSVNINIASYANEVRLTHNPSGRAYASTVREFYEQGCSVQFLNPQTYSNEMWMLTSTLQEFFGCFAGANIYLTPPGTQGFAPHYDDIEAFVMQIEGKKRWRLYDPPLELPRTSSENFKQSDLGKPILDVILEPGDLLYFPRGTVHQANAVSDTHSLHITLSTYQRNTWADFFEKLIPAALRVAVSDDSNFRKGLPIDYLNYMGIVHEDQNSSSRIEFNQKVHSLMSSIICTLPIDATADEMGLDYIHSSLPPYITDKESNIGVWKPVSNTSSSEVDITLNSRVRLLRKGSIRMVYNDESDKTVLYYNTNNSKVYHEKEPEGMEIGSQDEVIIKYLVKSYPDYVMVNDLPSDDNENKIDVAYMLYNQALITIEEN